jgi:hypothetical protein
MNATIPRQQLHCNRDRYFLRSPCRDVISRTSEELVSEELVGVLVGELLWFSRELLLLAACSWSRGPFENPEEGERPPLQAAPKQRQ